MGNININPPLFIYFPSSPPASSSVPFLETETSVEWAVADGSLLKLKTVLLLGLSSTSSSSSCLVKIPNFRRLKVPLRD